MCRKKSRAKLFWEIYGDQMGHSGHLHEVWMGRGAKGQDLYEVLEVYEDLRGHWGKYIDGNLAIFPLKKVSSTIGHRAVSSRDVSSRD